MKEAYSLNANFPHASERAVSKTHDLRRAKDVLGAELEIERGLVAASFRRTLSNSEFYCERHEIHELLR